MINKIIDFTYDAYVEFLGFLRRKYKIIPFCAVGNTEPPFLILRHDADASLDGALRMARIENKLGIQSTYLVLFSHRLYNLLEKNSATTLRKISKLGHEIGLHYDVQAYESFGQDLKKTLQMETKMLEHLLGSRVFSIACHNVSLMSGEDPFRNSTEYINVYDAMFCENYVSDSCRAWVLRDLSRLLNFEHDKVQLLIHPFLWTEDVCGRDAVLARLFTEVGAKNRKYKKDWLRVWHEDARVKTYDKSVTKLKRIEN